MQTILRQLRERAAQEGFEALRVTQRLSDPQAAAHLADFVARDLHGDMGWMAETLERRSDIATLWPEARSAILLAASYAPETDPLERLANRNAGVISVYAGGRDYHDVLKGRLKRLAQWFAHETKADVKVFVDTAPLMEKPLAARAGLGWQGKHTNLVSRELGSWFFIATILTTAELPPDDPETDHCGSCQACLDICPTRAFPAPYQLDARRCISYLTIEHKGPIAREFREAMGNRIYGCDDCLAACPWNKFAKAAGDTKLAMREELKAPSLSFLLGLDDQAFRTFFSGSPVKRTGRDRFMRNVLIAAGNSGDKTLVPQIETLLEDRSPLVRGMAVWALSRLADSATMSGLKEKHATGETDPHVSEEWQDI